MASPDASDRRERPAPDLEPSTLVWAGRCALLGVLAVLGAAVAWAGKGLRGTDQYWYAADLLNRDSVVGDGSNQLYPSFSLSAAAGAHDLPPRIHGVPATWAAEGAFQLGASDYHAWLVVNTVLALATAAACYATARALGLRRTAIWAPVLFLSFPLTTWLTLNALAEMSLAFFASLLVLGVVAADRSGARWGLFLAAAASGMLFWTRENFILVVIGFVLFCAWLRWRRGWRLPTVALAGVGAISFVVVRTAVFPKYPTSGLDAALMLSAPGSVRGMDMYYAVVDFQPGPFLAKLASGAWSALVPSGAVELVTESALLAGAVAAIVLLWKVRDRRVVAAWLIGMLVVYVATCMLYQAQNRYIYVVAPIASVAVACALFSGARVGPGRPAPWTPVAGVLTVVAFLAGSALMAQQYRSSAIDEMQTVADLHHALGGTDGPILSTGSDAAVISTAYAAAPRVVLVADAELNTTTEVAEMLQRRDAHVVLGPASDRTFLAAAVQRAFPGATLQDRGTVPTPGGPLEMWHIDER